MAIQSPGIALAVEALFGNVKPALDIIKKLGPTDFSAEAPGVEVKPGATIKVPLSTVSAANVFNSETNNYFTGGDTEWASLTASHYLQGFDLKGTDIDSGVNAGRIKQLFTSRAGTGIAYACVNAIRTALDGVTASSAVKLAAEPTLKDYDALASDISWFDRSEAVLAVNNAELAKIKSAMHSAHLSATFDSIAQELGFKDAVLVPGMTARACIIPYSTMGFMARVPALVARYLESGVETDPDSGLSVGIVVADDQEHNRIIANADIWFGALALSAPADAKKAGIIKVGTAS